jgi:hypothetical protein
MSDESREAPAEVVQAEPPADELVVAETVAQNVAGASPLAIFVGLIAMLLVSFGGAALVLGGTGRTTTGPSEATASPVSTPAAARTPSVAAATLEASRIRVTRTGGQARAMAGGAKHEVTFTWTLEGARENDQAVIQFYAGTRSLGQQRGTLDPTVFNFSTGTLTLTVAMECSSGGWTAEILTIRGQPVDGDAEASVPGVQCR